MPRIVSLNCWRGALYEPLMAYLRASQADVFCLQEVNRLIGPVPQEIRNAVRPDGYPERVDLFRDIQKELPCHDGYFIPGATGFLHDAKECPYVQYGIAAFVRRSMPIVRMHSTFAYGTYRHQDFGDPPLPRPVHGMELYDTEAKQSFVLVHLHGLWQPGTNKADTPERIVQAQIVRNVVHGLAQTTVHKIVCGDLNVLPSSETFHYLKEAGIFDLVSQHNIASTRTNLYTGEIRHADYVCASPSILVRGFDAPETPVVSDHRPLELDFGFKHV